MADRPNVCVIFNPAAGKRRARLQFDAQRKRLASKAVFWPTEQPGHAMELARQAANNGFAIVAAAGGDGTVHEVANGILESGNSTVTFAIIPLGSANDYAYSLQQNQITSPRPVDVGIIRTNRGTHRNFVCCLGIGFSANVTAESRRIHRLRGVWLYGMATLRALCRRWGHLDLSVSYDNAPAIHDVTLMLSVMIGQREGGFIMSPIGKLDDGLFDVIRAGRMSRWQVFCLLVQFAFRGLPQDHPQLQVTQCKKLLITSKQPMAIHTDGELFCNVGDGVHELEIQLIEKRLNVQMDFLQA